MNNITETEKQDVLGKCIAFLGQWSRFQENDVKVIRLTSGLANKTYRVSVENDDVFNNNVIEYKDVVVKIYNSGLFKEDNIIKFIGEEAEAVIVQILSKIGMAPKLLGVFPGGRIEQFIPSRTPTPDDLKNVDLCKAIIRKFAKFHSLEMPISKKADMFEKMLSMLSATAELRDVPEAYADSIDDCTKIMNFPALQEIAWANQMMPLVSPKIVFSHVDNNPNNILLLEAGNNLDDKVMLIDYEVCVYFYRAYDVASFLRFKSASISMVNNKISFAMGTEDASANDEIIEEYLKEYKRLNPDKIEPKIDNVDHLRMEIKFLTLAIDASLVGWSRHMIFTSGIPFPMGLAAMITQDYFERKRAVIEAYGDPLTWNTSQ